MISSVVSALLATLTLGGVTAAEPLAAGELDRAVAARHRYGFASGRAYVRRLASREMNRAAAEYGIAITAAEARDLLERAAFVQRLETSTLTRLQRLPGYGGAWIDQEQGGRLVVGLTRATDRLRNRARLSMPAVSRGIRFEVVDDSARSLAAGLRRAPAVWDALGTGVRPQAFAIHYRHNRITVKVPEDQLDAARSSARELRVQLGVDVGFEASPSIRDLAPRSACSSRTRCYGPFRTGVRVNFGHAYPSPKIDTFCGMGFHVRQAGSSSENGMFLTAGHCTHERVGPWQHHDDYKATYGRVGQRVASKYISQKRDIALISIEDWTANKGDRIYGEDWSSRTRLTDEGRVVEGETLCVSLARANRVYCGVADSSDQWWISTTANPDIRVRGAAMDFPGLAGAGPIPGDSGSPIYRRWTTAGARPEPRRTPIGIVNAGSVDTPDQEERHALYFAPVWWALNDDKGWPELGMYVAPTPLPRRAFTADWVGTSSDDHRTRFSAPPFENATSYRWDLGDGSQPRFGREFTHRYRRAGEYAVKLTVTYRDGHSQSRTLRIAANPVRTYAPLVFLHPAETSRPISAATFLEHTKLFFAHDAACEPSAIESGLVSAAKLGSGAYQGRVADDGDCSLAGPAYPSDLNTRPRDAGNELPADERDEGFYLDLDDSWRGGTPLANDPVYFESSAGRYVIYWLFYAYDDHGKAHEGDWEHIAVRLDGTGLAQQFAYYRHECAPVLIGRAEMRRGFGQSDTGFFGKTHPIVYAAKGSHASYWQRRQAWPVESGCGLPQSFPADTTGKGAPWKTWLDLQDVHADWYGYGGAWGPAGSTAVGPSINDGPLGPSKHKLPGAVPGWW